MRLTFHTVVQRPLPFVAERFDERLFRYLTPPLPPVRIVRYDGQRPGDEVHLELNFLLFRQRWISRIVSARTNPEEVNFVDEGIRLPFFLGRWHHRHRLLAMGSHATAIVDEIEFEAPVPWLSPLLAPALMGQFLARRPRYQSFFRHAPH